MFTVSMQRLMQKEGFHRHTNMGRLKGQNIWKCYMRCGKIRGIRVPAMAPALLITRQQRFTIRPMLNNNTLGACYGKAKQKGMAVFAAGGGVPWPVHGLSAYRCVRIFI